MSFLSETLRTKDFKTSGTDVEGFDWDDPGEDSENPIDKQTITTFTIGLGVAFSGDPDFLDGCYYLRNGASPSPSLEQPVGAEVVNDSNYACPSDPKGRYFFTALDEDALFNAFDSAMATALEETVSTGGKETISTSTPATAGTQIPELSAYFSLDTNIWASVLYFNAISSNGEIDTSEQKTADPYGSTGNKKRIIVNKGDGTNQWIYATRYTPAFYGVNTQAEIQLGLIPWLRRDASDNDAAIEANVAASVDAAKRTVPEYRVRTSGSEDPKRMMGDVIGSPTIAIPDLQGNSKYIVTAANDGLVHIFQKMESEDTPYGFTLGYLPGAMQRESLDDTDTVAKALPAVASAGYGESSEQPHLYLNDGGIVYRTTASTAGAGKQSFIVGAMGKGGRGVYALNIGGEDRLNPGAGIALDSNSLLQEVPLWETEKGSTNKLGYTVGTPQVGQIATEWNDFTIPAIAPSARTPIVTNGVRYYAFFGNGYPVNEDSSLIHPVLDSQPTLYIYDALGQEAGTSGAAVTGDAAGTLVRKISVTGGVGGLASPTLVDANGDNIADTAYAGDYGGNLYRFNLQGDPSEWSAVKIYQGNWTANSGYTQPITAAPAVYRRSSNEYVVIFGTGSDLYQDDLNDTTQQIVAGIYDNVDDTSPTPVQYSELVQQTMTQSGNYRYLSNNTFNIGEDKGWRLKLDNSTGERVTVKPSVLLSTAYVTTRSYTVSTSESDTQELAEYTCQTITETTSSKGQSWLLAINLLTGGTVDTTNGSYFASDTTIGGYKLDGTASATTLFTTGYYKNGGENPVTTENNVNGDVGGNGQTGEPGVTTATDNTCLRGEDYRLHYADAMGTDSVAITGAICPTAILRMNYRQVSL